MEGDLRSLPLVGDSIPVLKLPRRKRRGAEYRIQKKTRDIKLSGFLLTPVLHEN
jgi:hypothetical protein